MKNKTSQAATLPDLSSTQLGSLLTEHHVARLTAMSVATVRRWRLFGQGPRYIKIGAAVRYRPEDVKTYLDARPSGGGQTGIAR